MFTFLRSNSAFCKPRTLVVVANGRYNISLPAVGVFIIYMVYMFIVNVYNRLWHGTVSVVERLIIGSDRRSESTEGKIDRCRSCVRSPI